MLYNTWVSKFKNVDEPLSNELKLLHSEMVKFRAELRRTTEDLDILKKKIVAFPYTSLHIDTYLRLALATKPAN